MATATVAPVVGALENQPRSGPVTGWPSILRLQLRLDRIKSLVWIASVVALVVVSAISVSELYPDEASVQGYARLVSDNAAVVVQAGPGYGLQTDPSTGAVLMNELSLWTIVLVGLMSILLVTRHTRSEEETERAELLRSTPVGRHAAGLATMVNALLVNVVAAGAVILGTIASGFGAVGSIAFGLALCTSGLLFAAISLVAAQVAATGRAATGIGLAVLAVSFLLRAIGDVTGSFLTWLSPIGIGQGVRAFADERWWTPVLSLGLAAGVTWLATVLAARRDFGAGMIPERAGRPAATRWMQGPFALALRLQRGALLGWFCGIVFFAAFYGALASEAEEMLADNPDLEQFFALSAGSSITDAFLASAVLILALLLAGYGISGVLRLSGEENNGRVEALLATPTTRTRWASSHLLVTAIGCVGVAAAGGLAVGIGAAVTTGDSSLIAEMLWALLAYVPAVGVLAGVAFVLWAWVPRLAILGWVGLVWSAVVGLLAQLLDLPDWVVSLSPLDHVPSLPAEGFEATGLVTMAAATVLLVAAGLVGFTRRDLGSS